MILPPIEEEGTEKTHEHEVAVVEATQGRAERGWGSSGKRREGKKRQRTTNKPKRGKRMRFLT